MISRSILPGLPIVTLTLIACDPGGPAEPEAVQVPVYITTPQDMGLVGPMRIAVVWRQGAGTTQHWISTYDAPLTSLAPLTEVTLNLPPEGVRPSLTDTHEASFNCNESTVDTTLPVLVPRIVAYQDLDESGNFDPQLPQVPGIDRIWAVSPNTSTYQIIAAFTNLDQSLAQLPMEVAECIRSFTGGRYTAFLMRGDYSSSFNPESSKLSAELDLSSTDYASVLMGCSSSYIQVVSSSHVSSSDKTHSEQSTWADTRLTTNPCISAPWQCTQDDIAQLTWPDFEKTTTSHPGYSQSDICAPVGTLDVLWSITDSLECDGCDCTWVERTKSWIVESTSAPANWPCGKSVKYCENRQTSVWNIPEWITTGFYCGIPTSKRPE